MVGNWNKSEYGIQQKETFSQYKNIYLLDPVYESHEITWIRSNASLYIHGHSAGGTNLSLVAAMNFGIPIFSFDYVYNRETTKNACMCWKTSEDLNALLTDETIDLPAIAARMKELGTENYTWRIIAKQYNNLY